MTQSLVHPLLTSLARGSLVGGVIAFAGATAPPGWLLCFGQNVSRTTYAALFGVIGTTYGVGDGSTTFGLPDLRGRVIAGQDDMGGSSANRLTGLSGGVDGDVLGATGGAESHTLTTAQLSSHDHMADPPNTPSTGQSADHSHSGTTGFVSADHSHSGTTGTVSADHAHTTTVTASGGNIGAAGGGARLNSVGGGFSSANFGSGGISANHVHGFTSGGISANHIHAFTSGGASVNHIHDVNIASFTTGTAGSGGAHNNIQPTAILNYIIHTGVF